ncbi:MAG: YceI family protein [Chitinophagaceae bacterium]
MKPFLFFAGLMLMTRVIMAQDVYICKNAQLSFYSSAPVEDIKAVSKSGVSALNTKTGEIYFKVAINTFEFHSKLMQEHFNEDYLESDQFPFAEFKGKIDQAADLDKNGTYPVEVEGILTLHGVPKAYTTHGTLIVRNHRISASSTFNIHIADHHIKVPRLVIKNIAEDVQVSISANYIPMKTTS